MVGLKGDVGLPGEPGSAGQLVEIKGARGQKGDQGLLFKNKNVFEWSLRHANWNYDKKNCV